ncbi:MAG TPA: septum formation initiator family protein [Verrucomicrobiae bacterium]|nr:septum formation initiator family protein [Verrucomicrobiae bacterium]
MARNRKNQSAGLLVGPALKASLICFFILICCVGYVWQKKQIAELSHHIRNQENRLADLRYTNDQLKKQIAMLLSPPKLEARARELKLGLVPPQPAQIWRLPEPAAEIPAASKPEREYAAGRTGAVAAVMEQ